MSIEARYRVTSRLTDNVGGGPAARKKGYIDLAIQKSGSIFTTRLLKELSEEYTPLTDLYARDQSKLVKEVVANRWWVCARRTYL